eukprot:2046900-Rhodomonas_salina.1
MERGKPEGLPGQHLRSGGEREEEIRGDERVSGKKSRERRRWRTSRQRRRRTGSHKLSLSKRERVRKKGKRDLTSAQASNVASSTFL